MSTKQDLIDRVKGVVKANGAAKLLGDGIKRKIKLSKNFLNMVSEVEDLEAKFGNKVPEISTEAEFTRVTGIPQNSVQIPGSANPTLSQNLEQRRQMWKSNIDEENEIWDQIAKEDAKRITSDHPMLRTTCKLNQIQMKGIENNLDIIKEILRRCHGLVDVMLYDTSVRVDGPDFLVQRCSTALKAWLKSVDHEDIIEESSEPLKFAYFEISVKSMDQLTKDIESYGLKVFPNKSDGSGGLIEIAILGVDSQLEQAHVLTKDLTQIFKTQPVTPKSPEPKVYQDPVEEVVEDQTIMATKEAMKAVQRLKTQRA